MNMATLSSLQNEVTAVNDQLNRLAQDRVQMDAHLSSVKNQLDVMGLFASESPSASSSIARENEEARHAE